MSNAKYIEIPSAWGVIGFCVARTYLVEQLAKQGLHLVSDAGKRVVDLAPDVAANFGKPRSAEREIAFMRAVNDMLREVAP
jgi:hypothetical protein